MKYFAALHAADILVILTDKGIELTKVSNDPPAAIRLLKQEPRVLVVDERGPEKLWSFVGGPFIDPTLKQEWKVKHEPVKKEN